MTISNGPAEPFTISLETPNYLLRTIDSSDATEDWGNWLLEPTTLSALNAAPLKLDIAMIRSYIATFDRKKSHLLGIFHKESRTLIGIRALYIDWPYGEFMVNILIGQPGARAKGAMRETRDALYHHLFEDWGLEIARSSVLASNTLVNAYMQADGWQLLHSTVKPTAGGGGTIEVREYQMSRDQNRRYERRRGIFQRAKAG
jgi:hypothetical protein